MLEAAEIRVIEHIARKKPSCAVHLLDYVLGRLKDGVARTRPAAEVAPHPDAARLDWLQAHDADLREDSGKWWVEPRLGCRTHRDSPDARTAIDRAIDRNKET